MSGDTVSAARAKDSPQPGDASGDGATSEGAAFNGPRSDVGLGQAPGGDAVSAGRQPAESSRDPFADDVLRRLVASNRDYQNEHGHYIVPLAQRLLDARAALRRIANPLPCDCDDGVSECYCLSTPTSREIAQEALASGNFTVERRRVG